MGKGDVKTKKGKIFRGSYGLSRRRKKHENRTAKNNNTDKKKEE